MLYNINIKFDKCVSDKAAADLFEETKTWSLNDVW